MAITYAKLLTNAKADPAQRQRFSDSTNPTPTIGPLGVTLDPIPGAAPQIQRLDKSSLPHQLEN